MHKRFILAILIICFTVGTITHVLDIYSLGFFGYAKLAHVGSGLNIFWSLLVVFDPIVILLLFTRRMAGIIVGFVVLLSDVAVNSYFVLKFTSSSVVTDQALALQIFALLFSAFTLPLWLSHRSGTILKIYPVLFSYLPHCSFIYWFCLHIFWSAKLSCGMIPPTLWNIWSQVSMLCLDAFIIIALLKKTRIGFYAAFIAIVIVSAEIIICCALAYAHVLNTPVSISAGIGLAMCLLSITALIISKHRYTLRFFVKSATKPSI